MTPYQKYLGVWLLFAAVEMVLFASFRESPYFLYAFFGVLVLASLAVRAIECPRCGTTIGYGGKSLGIRMPRSFFDKRCNECGCDLNAH